MEIAWWLALLCVSALFPEALSQDKQFLVTAPTFLRLDAAETIFVQLFGYAEEVNVFVTLKSSMGADPVTYSQETVTLNQANHYQGICRVQLFPKDLIVGASHVILLVQGPGILDHRQLDVSRNNGFMFIQTDKPLYTPEQSVKVRVFSLNEELRPANRKVFLTFKDPEGQTVDIVELIDHNNGIPSMQNPFKIPLKPKLGIWSIDATYTKDFNTQARATFEVKEYVLPSISITVKPEKNYVSSDNFQRFAFKISASYVHGAPVGGATVFIRYGSISGNKEPMIFPNSMTRKILSPSGVVDVHVDLQALVVDTPYATLEALNEKYLYITVLVQEYRGGISEETEYSSVKFAKSPYKLQLISTPRFIKPGAPYTMKVVVRDPSGQPQAGVPVTLEDRCTVRDAPSSCDCLGSEHSGAGGFVDYICNIAADATVAHFKFQTAAPGLQPEGQAGLSVEAPAYRSPHRCYLYMEPPDRHALQVGHTLHLKVYAITPANLRSGNVNYLVLSKGKVLAFGVGERADIYGQRQILRIKVTPEMTPSVRVVAYYFVEGEVVADSLWLEVQGGCVNRLTTELSYREGDHRPKSQILLDVSANQDGFVALSAVDAAIFPLRRNRRDPVDMVLRHVELSDQGCGGGGGRDVQGVFQLSGLSLLTNAFGVVPQSAGTCQDAVRAKRSLTEEQKKQLGKCCEKGLNYVPTYVTCEKYAHQSVHKKNVRCRKALQDCCERNLEHIPDAHQYGRVDMGSDLDKAPSVRSYFPESWLWEVHPIRGGRLSVTESLPDSLTTWDITAVGMFPNGICVGGHVQVPVTLPVSVNVPLPYQLVRGEQLDLLGTVYNSQPRPIQYCVTLTLGPEFCLVDSQSVGDSELQSTPCEWKSLPGNSLQKAGPFTLLGLQPGEHTLTVTLKTRDSVTDIVQKKLRVVPEGVRRELLVGGRLDPRSIYGSEKKKVTFENRALSYLVPDSSIQRVISIHGEIIGDMLSVVLEPEGLKKLIRLPSGFADATLDMLLPLIHIYRYLEENASWDILGPDVQGNSARLRKMIKEGVTSVLSFRDKQQPAYCLWKKGEVSTWLTAKVVATFALLKNVMRVDFLSLGQSVDWLIRHTRNGDGSFRELSEEIKPVSKVPQDQSVYLSSFVLMSLKRATLLKDPALRLESQQAAMAQTADYITQHAMGVKSVYVRSVATHALTYYNPTSRTASDLFDSLETLAHERGDPVDLRYWQEPGVTDWQQPDAASGAAVRSTANVLLAALLRGRLSYVRPIISWLTQDQQYGGGFYSSEEMVVTLEAITEYSQKLTRSVLDQNINIQFKGVSRKDIRTSVVLNANHRVAPPIEVFNHGDITVSTGYGSGVSHVKMKTVYYQTTPSVQNCNFDYNIEISKPQPYSFSHALTVCIKFRPPPNEVEPESGPTTLEIELPTGVKANLDDLKQFQQGDIPAVSDFWPLGNMVIMEMTSIPSDIFRCVGFQVRSEFTVLAAAKSVFRVTEKYAPESVCEKQFRFREEDLQRLCLGDRCQCMTAACARYRGNNTRISAEDRIQETCQDRIKYAYKVRITSELAEGDFMISTGTVLLVLRRGDQAFEAVRSGVEVDLVKKATCSSVQLQVGAQFLVQGTQGSQVLVNEHIRYRFPLDSGAVVELLTESRTRDDGLIQYEEDLPIYGCG